MKRLLKRSIIFTLVLTMIMGAAIFGDNTYLRHVKASNFLVDDFEDGSSDGWQVVVGDPYKWSVVTYGNSKRFKYDTAVTALSISLAGETRWDDYVLKAEVIMPDDGPNDYGCLLFRVKDKNNFYMAQLMYEANKVRLLKCVDGSFTQIGPQVDCTLEANTVYRLKAVAHSSSLKVYVDDVLKIDETDSTFSYGKIGLRSYTTAFWDNIEAYNDITFSEAESHSGIPPGTCRL
jgi:hypothetical protein